MSDLVKVAALSELAAGTCKTVDIKGKLVALCHVKGSVYALDNTCLHRGGPLGEGTIEGETLTCPWHGWQYDVKTGENLMNRAVQVATYPVQVEGNDIKIAV